MPKNRVAYYYDSDEGHYYYGPGHPMKPHRLKLTHHLLLSYGLYRQLEVYRPHKATAEEMMRFHTEDYITFLQKVQPDNARNFANALSKFAIGEFTDCPVFDGMYEFAQTVTGASVDGAVRLNHGQADICVNWGGGLHHAKKSEASGFCYVNDIVLAILELLKYHARVLYIDIDIHHGDGVEEAFYVTDRVMTVSFHKFGDFFPGTGAVKDIGAKAGKYHSINFPLREGIDDLSYEHIFKPVITAVMAKFRPGTIVLQCGADSLTGDRLGCFNLTLKGHAECVKFVKGFGVPVLVLGGGGYTIRNVARCWTYETATLLDARISNDIPAHTYRDYFGPDYKLHLTPENKENANSPAYLDKMKATILEHLKCLEGAPGVAFHQVPPDWRIKEGGDDGDPDKRSAPEGRRAHEAEYYDGPTDHDGSGGGRPPAMKRARRPSIGDWESSGAGAGSGSGSGSGSGTAALAQGGAGGAGAGAK